MRSAIVFGCFIIALAVNKSVVTGLDLVAFCLMNGFFLAWDFFEMKARNA